MKLVGASRSAEESFWAFERDDRYCRCPRSILYRSSRRWIATAFIGDMRETSGSESMEEGKARRNGPRITIIL